MDYPARAQINAHLQNKDRLEAIRDYYRARNQPHMSMTRILEVLIDREFKRLKLGQETVANG